MQKDKNLIGFIMMVTAMILVGSTIVVSKIISESMPPFTATALRFAISSPVFAVILWFSGQKIPLLSKAEWGLLVIQAATGSVAYTVLILIGISYTSGANVSIIVGTLPIIMGILAITLFSETLTSRFLVALLLTASGVLLITLNSEDSDHSFATMKDFLGISLIILAVIGEAIFLLLNKKIKTPLPAVVLATLMSTFGFLLTIIPALFEFKTGAVEQISQQSVLGVIYYALVPTVIGFILWYEGSARSSSSEAALATAFLPLSALLLVSIILDEPVSIYQAAGCLFVIVAIIVGAGKKAQKRGPEPPKSYFE